MRFAVANGGVPQLRILQLFLPHWSGRYPPLPRGQWILFAARVLFAMSRRIGPVWRVCLIPLHEGDPFTTGQVQKWVIQD
jgi:hypothetical protein